jgi:hypothetical protein
MKTKVIASILLIVLILTAMTLSNYGFLLVVGYIK